MKRMYRAGAGVVGPSSPSKCKICVDSMVNSQSSMNSHRCNKLLSVDSGTARINEMMELTMLRLNSKPPSSRKKLLRNPTKTRCLAGYVRQSFCRRADDGNLVLVRNFRQKGRNLLEQAFNGIFRSRLEQRCNGECRNGAVGITNQSFQIFIALGDGTGVAVGNGRQGANGGKARAGLGARLKNSCSVQMAGFKSCASAPGRWQMARAASYTTNSDLCRKLASRN